jgi:N-acetylglucosamine kinase-like BadF-type ATPase
MDTMLHDAVLGVDLGKTSCRIRVSAAEDVLAEVTGPGAPGLADDAGDELAFEAIVTLTDTIDPDVLARIGAVGIGAAGVEAHPDAARSLAKRVSERFHAPTAIINDALLAHLGAFGGGPGTILIAGTGAIAFSLDASGLPRQVDGWGPLLGDDGGGRWIGQEGIKAALRELDGRSGPTSLTQAAEQLAGELRALPAWVSRTGEEARQLASFAPVVIQHAEDGDAVAQSIVEAAAEHLANTAKAASTPAQPVCIVGGLFDNSYFHRTLLAVLTRHGISNVNPIGNPLDGAARIATVSTFPHETRTIRV